MIPKNIKSALQEAEHLMYGFNYMVTLGIDLFEGCYSVPDVNDKIKSMYVNSNPADIKIIRISVEEFWEDISAKFNFRGDEVAGLQLSEKEEQKLKEKQGIIKDFISQYIMPGTNIYYYPSLEGIPGYVVFWDYYFAILNTDGSCLFVYGSSSD